MVEFALILLPLTLIVVGIIQFGIALNYWLDINRLANQGARWAAVNEYPGCPRTGPDSPCSPSLQEYIACQPIVDNLKPTVTVFFPESEDRGDPVSVTVSAPFTFVPLLNIGTLTLNGSADMRIEQNAGRYASGPGTCP